MATLPGEARAGEYGPLRFMVSDVVGEARLKRDFGPFIRELARLSGQEFRFTPTHSRTEALGAAIRGECDLALTGPAEYVVFQARAEARPVIAFSRPDYFSAIVTLARREFHTVHDLRWRAVAFGPRGSTSNHLGPMWIFADHGVNPRRSIKAAHMSGAEQWAALKSERVDAVGMNHNHGFLPLRERETDMPPGAFRVVGRGADLPDDMLVATRELPQSLVIKLRRVFAENQEQLAAALLRGPGNAKYQGLSFLTHISDDDYGIIRAMYANAGYSDLDDFPDE